MTYAIIALGVVSVTCLVLIYLMATRTMGQTGQFMTTVTESVTSNILNPQPSMTLPTPQDIQTIYDSNYNENTENWSDPMERFADIPRPDVIVGDQGGLLGGN